jgi:hypothetical protein
MAIVGMLLDGAQRRLHADRPEDTQDFAGGQPAHAQRS